MDSYDASDKTREEPIAAKQRFESFRLGSGPSNAPAANLAKLPQMHGRSHSRSHSRNTSISSVSSISALSISSVQNSVKLPNDMPPRPNSASAAPPSKRNSHHRRRSSVSTRRESAEMMGVSVPDLPPSLSEDNINLGEKDSVRRRALWALEGKGDVAFSKVEIPELDTSNAAEKKFDFPSKPSFPPGAGSSFGGMASKRDSFKLLGSSSSSKDQLGTLVEEEEEEEDTPQQPSPDSSVDISEKAPEPAEPACLTVAVTKPSSARPRPSSLNLRPLSLTPDSHIFSGLGGLPTPTHTPSPRTAGLKSLALAASPQTAATNAMISSTLGMNRQSLAQHPSQHVAPARRPSLHLDFESPTPASIRGIKSKRPSSIQYRSSTDSTYYSQAGLPTPEMTPTSERHLSLSSSDDEISPYRPLSTSEQHFLFKSHNALLSRITDLERALTSQARSSRASSRHMSISSDTSMATSEPSDEMLQLIADLKAERDELKRDVDGWRTRVNDLEKQVGIFAKRVEVERREAWVARSRVGLLEIEKTGLEKALLENTNASRVAEEKLELMKEEQVSAHAMIQRLQADLQKSREVEDECAQLKAALDAERKKREDAERALEGVATPTPVAFEPMAMRSRGFTSLDSESSFTDVESVDDSLLKEVPPLNSVVEEDEDDMSDEDSGLAGYEDEQDSDESFASPDGSSLGSEDEFMSTINVEATPDLVVSALPSRDSTPSPSMRLPAPVIPARPTHGPHASLSKTWTFPTGARPVPSTLAEVEDVDRFFACLDEADVTQKTPCKVEQGDSPFSVGYHFGADADSDGDDLPPFVIPSSVGVEVSISDHNLGMVLEEEEEEDTQEGDSFDTSADSVDDGEEVAGVKFTFTPPEPEYVSPSDTVEASPSPARQSAPFFAPFDEDEDDDTVPFTFPQFRQEETSVNTAPSTPKIDGRSTPARNSPSPSSIPRAVALKSFTASPNSTPLKSPTARFASPAGYSSHSFITPPPKRTSNKPSFIPTPSKPAAKPKAAPTSTFMRQPQRKAVPVAPSRRANGSTSKPLKPSISAPTYSSFLTSQPTIPLTGPLTSQPPHLGRPLHI
ncbi:hypothetical protein PLICRDRAFT_234247 [Plicaturopsis crispa FD-325 SS-3]|nr:hypothetical protein PLICRDRAFT_234247 [Plicaturopsis crispa FD-325 SS-3]